MKTLNPERVLTLGEAVKITGFSAGKFRYQKTQLLSAGVRITPDGWQIPIKALTALGWVGVKPPKGELTDTPLSVALAKVAKLEAENAELRVALTRRPSLFKRRAISR